MKKTLYKRFQQYKDLGDKTFVQLTAEQLGWKYNEESNSIATLVKHMHGNMKSRWTNFRTEDGEKSWRKRDEEFENDIKSKTEMLQLWEEGWEIFFKALDEIEEDNWQDLVQIGGQKLTVFDAVLRQLAHYSYHVGQIVYLGKMLSNEKWRNLSIEKNRQKVNTLEELKNQNSTEIQENSSPVCYAKSDEVRDDYKI
ncbi:DinB family protein [Kaistella polysaccharea]|uniref:DinB family protein n=1 Tax=Kaistella polysaccharea TaxID=2878534 RepID=UPI001CF29B2E|nr:DinB family protein [Kaistella polysaccharea]